MHKYSVSVSRSQYQISKKLLTKLFFTQRAKWIAFPTAEVVPPKHKIGTPSEAVSFVDLLAESIRVITK